MSIPSTRVYKTLNWPDYNKALKWRGSLTVWFDPDMTWAATPIGKRGRQPIYSNCAIQTCLTMKVLFGIALRQTTGFVESPFHFIGLGGSGFQHLETPAEDPRREHPYSRVRSAASTADLKHWDQVRSRAKASETPVNTMVRNAVVGARSTSGLKSKRRRFELLKSPEMKKRTPPMLPELLNQIPLGQEIASVTVDGAYDTRMCHDAIAKLGAAAVIPPRRDAKA